MELIGRLVKEYGKTVVDGDARSGGSPARGSHASPGERGSGGVGERQSVIAGGAE